MWYRVEMYSTIMMWIGIGIATYIRGYIELHEVFVQLGNLLFLQCDSFS